jgi:hypothetical protein
LSLFFLHSIYIIFYPFSSLSSYYDNLAFWQPLITIYVLFSYWFDYDY